MQDWSPVKPAHTVVTFTRLEPSAKFRSKNYESHTTDPFCGVVGYNAEEAP